MAVWATKVALTVSGGRVNPFVRVLILLALSLWPAQAMGQTAAAGVVSAIRIAVPENGRQLNFRRALQIDPAGEVSVAFKVGSGRFVQILNWIWPGAMLFVALWGWLALRRPPPSASAGPPTLTAPLPPPVASPAA